MKKLFPFLLLSVEPKVMQTMLYSYKLLCREQWRCSFDARSCSFLRKTFQWLFDSLRIKSNFLTHCRVLCDVLPAHSPSLLSGTCPGFLCSFHFPRGLLILACARVLAAFLHISSTHWGAFRKLETGK